MHVVSFSLSNRAALFARSVPLLLCIGLLWLYATQIHADVKPRTEDSVHAQTASRGDNPDSLLIAVSVDRKTAYVAEQILLTIQISVPVEAFAINGNNPKIVGAQSTVLSKVETRRKFDNREFRLLTTRIAVFAQQPGTLTLPSVTYTGTLPVGFTSRGAPGSNPHLKSSSESIELEILPHPTTTSLWLPAQAVTITSSWAGPINQASLPELVVGVPVRRSVLVEAKAQVSEWIPNLPSSDLQDLRVYPAPTQVEKEIISSSLISRRIHETTIVATKPGEFELPEVTLEWWDTKNTSWRTARLAAERFRVIADSDAVHDAETRLQEFTHFAQSWSLFQIAFAFTLTLLGAGLLCALLMNHRLWTDRVAKSIKNERQAWAQVKQGIGQENLQLLRTSLVQWNQFYSNDSMDRGIESITKRYPNIANELGSIEYSLYAKQSGQPVDLRLLATKLRRIRKKRRNTVLKKRLYEKLLAGNCRHQGQGLYPNN